MTGLERTRAAIQGRAVDCIPVFPILLAPACRLTGVRQREYNLDAAGDQLLDVLFRTVNGRLTAAEALGHREFVLTKLYRSA